MLLVESIRAPTTVSNRPRVTRRRLVVVKHQQKTQIQKIINIYPPGLKTRRMIICRWFKGNKNNNRIDIFRAEQF